MTKSLDSSKIIGFYLIELSGIVSSVSFSLISLTLIIIRFALYICSWNNFLEKVLRSSQK